MNQGSADSSQRKPHRNRRCLLFGVSVLLLVVGIKVGYDYFRNRADEADLQAAIAETDQLDPGWRLEDLEAKRAIVPPERDAAPVVTKAGASAIGILNTKNVRKDLLAITKEVKKLA